MANDARIPDGMAKRDAVHAAAGTVVDENTPLVVAEASAPVRVEATRQRSEVFGSFEMQRAGLVVRDHEHGFVTEEEEPAVRGVETCRVDAVALASEHAAKSAGVAVPFATPLALPAPHHGVALVCGLVGLPRTVVRQGPAGGSRREQEGEKRAEEHGRLRGSIAKQWAGGKSNSR